MNVALCGISSGFSLFAKAGSIQSVNWVDMQGVLV